MKLTDEQMELYRTAFLGGYLQKWEFEEILSSEQAWKEEAKLLRKGKESAERLMFQHSDENLLLRKQLKQAIEVLQGIGSIVSQDSQAMDASRKANDFLFTISSLQEDKT